MRKISSDAEFYYIKTGNSTNKRKKLPVFICLLLAAGIAIGLFLYISHNNKIRVEMKANAEKVAVFIRSNAPKTKTTAEQLINFYTLIINAEEMATEKNYEAAIHIYEEAKQAAINLVYQKGIIQSETGIKKMHDYIKTEKRNEAMHLFVHGDELYSAGEYLNSLEFFYGALELYAEINDHQNIVLTMARINYAEQMILEAENQQNITDNNGSEDTSVNEEKVINNYEHNLNINFDMQTPIDYQDRGPASEIRMGKTDGYNEGWYNGCGWIATFNALILLDNPIHPAEIVRHFEENVGTVLGGVFGTYPNAIEKYLKGLGYDVKHTLFPQLTLNIDETIRNSKVCILAYAHTSAAHYVTVEYREDIDKFIVYNDYTARRRSEDLGFHKETNIGAAIDSVEAFLNDSRNILFSFSLIVVS